MWLRFGVMLLLSFCVMFALMYLMADKWADVYPNLNQIYMTPAMVASTAIIELVVVSGMYKNAAARFSAIGAAAVLPVIGIAFTRYQTGVGNTSFLHSMIPHHSGAILICTRASITDPEIKTLCQGIIKSQSQEIEQMNAILARPR